MLLVDEPGTGRLFVNDMRGPALHASATTEAPSPSTWTSAIRAGASTCRPGVGSGASRASRSTRSSREPGTPGYGKLYTWADSTDTAPPPDFMPGGGGDSHDTVLLEWTAADAGRRHVRRWPAPGGAPRSSSRSRNHNGGQLAFNPRRLPGDPDFGMLYVGVADGGSGGDPHGHGAGPGVAFGKILRIDPLGSNSRERRVRHPRRQPVRGASAARWARSGRTVCATPSGSAGTRPTATCSWPTSGRTSVEELSPVHARREPGLERVGGQLPLPGPRPAWTPRTRAAIPP